MQSHALLTRSSMALPADPAEQRGGQAAEAHPAGEGWQGAGDAGAAERRPFHGTQLSVHLSPADTRVTPLLVQVFVRMPLMHSELLADQDVSRRRVWSAGGRCGSAALLQHKPASAGRHGAGMHCPPLHYPARCRLSSEYVQCVCNANTLCYCCPVAQACVEGFKQLGAECEAAGWAEMAAMCQVRWWGVHGGGQA